MCSRAVPSFAASSDYLKTALEILAVCEKPFHTNLSGDKDSWRAQMALLVKSGSLMRSIYSAFHTSPLL